MARSKTANTFVWILLGLLVLGLMGFGAAGLGGQVRTIGQVGDKPITVSSYANAINQELSDYQQTYGIQIGFAQADALGLDEQALQRLITERTLDNEAVQIGLSSDDGRVLSRLRATPAFIGSSGEFDTEAYSLALRERGLGKAEYETSIRDTNTRALLLSAVATGTGFDPYFARLRSDFIGETRNIRFVLLTEADLETPVADPSPEELETFYAENPALFTAPEARRITYVLLTPEMMMDQIEVDEAEVDAAYEARLAEFNEPERRLVDGLPFPSEEDAAAAMARITSGETTFDEEITARGLTAPDVDLGDLSEADLDTAGPEIFALEAGQVAGPLEGRFGPTLYRVNAIFAAQETPVEEAKEQIRTEMALEAARRAILIDSPNFDDLLAGGETLETLAEQTAMELGTIDWSANSSDGIAAFEEFRRAAITAEIGDFPELIETGDGSVLALRLDEIIPERLLPPADVSAELLAATRAKKVTDALTAEAEAIIARLSEGGTLAATGLIEEVREGLDRTSFVDGLPPIALRTIFDLNEGEAQSLATPRGVAIVMLDAIVAADPDTPESQQRIELITEVTEQAVGQDLLTYYLNALLLETPAEINEQTREQLNGSFGNAARP